MLLVERDREAETLVSLEALLRLRAHRVVGGTGAPRDPLADYRYRPWDYIREKLGWEPWAGTKDEPGQREILEAYVHALRQQDERNRFEAGDLAEADLMHWHPGEPIRNQLRIEAGHTVGKTKLASGIVNHFFDCFVPSIVYSFAPSWEQIHDLLWKEIKADRRGKGLPGRILDLALDRGDEHFAKGRATNNAGGRGTERIQGQHGRHLLFVFDEAEGIADYVWDAVKSMTSGGLAIVLMLANPRTRTSRFHKARTLPSVRSFRLSCIWHPNVLQGREIVPGAVRRDYVDSMLDEHCAVVAAHRADDHTFEVPWRPGLIFQPDAEFQFRVLGVAPGNLADNTLVPLGRYEAAAEREPQGTTELSARMGVDVARYGKDFGTVYGRRGGAARRVAQLYHQDTTAYAEAIKAEARALADDGVTSLHVRVDGGGGFGGGVIDQLNHDLELVRLFRDFQVQEVHFNGTPSAANEHRYADKATELYAEAAETLKGLALEDPPALLEGDLTERTYKWMNRKGVSVKRLEPKDDFKKRIGHSPDDGDGFVLAVAPDFVFTDGFAEALTGDAVDALAGFRGV